MRWSLTISAVVGLLPVAAAQSPAQSPAPAFYHLSPKGNDADPGTAARPLRTLAFAVTKLRPGDTLFVGGGVYFERGIRLAMTGTPTAPITIRSLPGTRPVFDGAYEQFRTVPNRDWEVHDGRRNVFRSVQTFPQANIVFGYLGPRDGGYRLVPYASLASLSADREDYSDTAPYYCGPGLFWNPADQRIYVRLVHGGAQRKLGFSTPASLDPRFCPLVVFQENPVWDIRNACDNVNIDGITVRYGEPAIEIAGGCSRLTMSNCEALGGRYEFVVRGARELTLDALRVDGKFPPWVARSDVKAVSPMAHEMQGAALTLEDNVTKLVIRNSVFVNLFDAIDTIDAPTHLQIHNNLIEGIRDDAIELATAGYRYDVHDNIIRNCVSGIAWNGTGSPPPGFLGLKFIHHNLIDTRRSHFYARSDPDKSMPGKWRGPGEDGMATGRAFETHDLDKADDGDPWKIYHNTVLASADVDGSGVGASYPIEAFDAQYPHEVYNNVFVQYADHPILQDVRVADRSQLFDGNLYFRTDPAATTHLLEDVDNGNDSVDFRTLVDFMTSYHWLRTFRLSPPGWEVRGVEADPRLDSAGHPAADGPGARGSVDLSSRLWPGTSPHVPWRGALIPR